MMNDLISRGALYDMVATLEADALEYVAKLVKRDRGRPSEEWKIWSAILAERTSFKHDVYDAPSVGKVGHWIDNKVAFHRVCSECGAVVRQDISEVYLLECMEKVGKLNYCPNCGVKMEVE